jgi:biotin carboxyl carrier protein
MDLKKIEQIVKMLGKSKVRELSLVEDDFKITLTKGAEVLCDTAVPPVKEKVVNVEPAIVDDGLVSIKSLGVGFFSSSVSDKDIESGKVVKTGTTVFSIRSMNIENERKLENDCIIKEICVENGKAVEYGQVLLKVKEI